MSEPRISAMDMRKQVADQYRVVAHLASAIAHVHQQVEPVIGTGRIDDILPMMGERSSRLMETLGDILNAMDAATEGDAWMDTIFDKSHLMFPAEGAPRGA